MTSNGSVPGKRGAAVPPGLRRPDGAAWIVVCVAFLAATAIGSARAGSTAPLALTVAQANEIVAQASHGSVHVAEIFPGPDGMVGAIVVGRSAGRGIAWLTPHGDALFLGGVLRDQQGHDLTQAAMSSVGMQLAPAAVLAQASDPERRAILVGSGGPLLTVMLDPNGIDDRRLYDALSPEVASGRVRVRYLLVGALKPSSVPRAASILAAATPAQALAANEAKYDVRHAEGGFPIVATPDLVFVSVVEGNNELLARAGAAGTPATYYCSKATRKARAMFGVPPNIQVFLMQADPSGIACGESW